MSDRQLVMMLILVIIAMGLGIRGAPNSYAYKVLTGQCSHQPMPMVCHRRGRFG